MATQTGRVIFEAIDEIEGQGYTIVTNLVDGERSANPVLDQWAQLPAAVQEVN
jgi:hypothetical protein